MTIILIGENMDKYVCYLKSQGSPLTNTNEHEKQISFETLFVI